MSAWKFTLIAIVLEAFVMLAWGDETAPLPHYLLKVRIEPSANRIESEVTIQHAPDSDFYLHPNMGIHRVVADGQAVSFQRDASDRAQVRVEGDVHQDLLIEYSGSLPAGSLPEMSERVSRVNADLVELALYAGWYPRFENANHFDFQLEADLPQDFVTVTNGLLKEQLLDQGRNRTRWVSLKPDFDIVLLASPHLQKREEKRMGTTIEIYFDEIPKEKIQAQTDSLLKGMNRFSDLYGPPRVKGLLRMVNSPRDGWGYSRIPLFVIPEAYVQTLLEEEFGQGRYFHGAAHEMAHF